mmetsp:Transcript_17300/g.35255  ORF Transcript_17300/g.35255 Transcript_17300/m.35255 type:complete len:250 (+) Transcript_17300:366-1115(+)
MERTTLNASSTCFASPNKSTKRLPKLESSELEESLTEDSTPAGPAGRSGDDDDSSWDGGNDDDDNDDDDDAGGGVCVVSPAEGVGSPLFLAEGLLGAEGLLCACAFTTCSSWSSRRIRTREDACSTLPRRLHSVKSEVKVTVLGVSPACRMYSSNSIAVSSSPHLRRPSMRAVHVTRFGRIPLRSMVWKRKRARRRASSLPRILFAKEVAVCGASCSDMSLPLSSLTRKTLCCCPIGCLLLCNPATVLA